MPSSSPHVNKHDIQFLLDSPHGPSPPHVHARTHHHTHSSRHTHGLHARRLPPHPTSTPSHSSFPGTSHTDARAHSPLSPQSTPSPYSSQTTRSNQSPSPTPISSPNNPAHVCKECSQHFTSPNELTAHVRSTHRLKPFACKICDKTFAERGNANKHYRVAHLKQRNHRCATCDRCFAFRDGLNRHISMVHLNERPFECSECMCPGGPHPADIACTHICGMRFKQKSHRRRHVLSVHHAARRGDDQTSSFVSLPHLRLPPHRSQHVS